MKKFNNKWFSLVELLVVITILAIISVVAYQNFWGATDKAIASRKKTDISTIETALQQFKSEKNYYPMPQDYNWTSNLWWYNSWATATPSDKIKVTYKDQEIASIITTDTNWWGKVYASWSATIQVWAKWVIWYNGDFGKKYLSKDLYDPELWDVKVWSGKMIDNGIWRYVYWVYALPKAAANWNISKATWSYFNIATTLKKSDWETYETYIVWDYDSNSCSDWSTSCPDSLIWSDSVSLKTWNSSTWTTQDDNQWIPYPIRDFAQ